MPGTTAKGAGYYERVLTWALEAEKLDLPQLGARCERMIVVHWEHLNKYKLLIAALSSDARHRIMMGMFKADKSNPLASRRYPSWEDFMSWRTAAGGAS